MRQPDPPGSARAAVHKAFRTTVSRGGVAPFCYALNPPGPCDTPMPRKPTHGGSRLNAGRPVSTGSSSTPPVTFRLPADDYRALVKAAKKMDKTPNQVAKSALLGFLYLRP